MKAEKKIVVVTPAVAEVTEIKYVLELSRQELVEVLAGLCCSASRTKSNDALRENGFIQESSTSLIWGDVYNAVYGLMKSK